MSERINVDHAFDPEARQAQADFDAYLTSRPAHEGEVSDTADSHYDESLETGDYAGESLDQLAQRVADARADGDTTRANDAEEAFFTKFNDYAQKYGWENEVIDESATGQLAVDKDARIGRDTIDARLERYGNIMYGDAETSEVPDKAGVETPETTETADASDAGSEQPSLLPNLTQEEIDQRLTAVRRAREEMVAEQAGDDTDGEAQPRPDERPAAGIVGVDSEVEGPHETDNPVSGEGLEPLEVPAEEGESLEEYEARNGIDTPVVEPLSLEGLEPVDPEADEETQEQSRWKRLGARLSPTALAARALAWNTHRNHKRERSESRERSGNKKALIGLGVLGVVAAGTAIYLGNKYGVDLRPGSGNGSNGAGNELAGRQSGAGGLSWNDFDSSARRVTPGEGFNSTFDQMGIPKKDWNEVLATAGPKLGKLGEAYYDNGSNEWRISRPGNLSGDALRVIASASRKNGVEL